MRVLVIGGSGFIGPHVVDALENAGHDVTVFHRASKRSARREILGDRQHLGDYAGQLRALKPDVVIDVILSSGRQARALVNVFRGAASRLVALSSCDVYRACGVLHGLEPGPLEPVPLTEESPLRTNLQTYPPERITMLQQVFGWLDDEYDKIPVEREIRGDRELPGTVLRLPMVYGPGDPLHRFLPIVRRVDDGRKTIVFEEGFARWRAPRGYVGNVAAAIALAAMHDRAAGRVFNVGETDNLTELEWAERIATAMNWKGRFITLPRDTAPAHLVMPGNTDQHWTIDTSRIRGELGYREPVAQDEAIRGTIEWERANPTLSSAHAFDYDAEDLAVGTT
ncbi:MAG TPA: NAD-dependent epimerase/dehydratase family protein [Vicinamibacterales bacterium]|jgi:nucleoside-diphosphate-sugar epimerase|nr:NAD-dependent epimerase/dehydratase family protein [Vicinamibacterales bacterium]